jgi:hypothetical protein
MKKQKISIIKSEGSLQRIKEMLENYSLFDINNEDAFILYGYKTLHPGAKDTYRVLKNHQKALKSNPVKVSLDLLGIELGTSSDSQADRISQLVAHELVIKHKSMYECSSYQILTPLPDFTFAQTLHTLINRRELGQLIHEVKKETNLQERITKMQKIKTLVKKGVHHPDIHYIDNALLN